MGDDRKPDQCPSPPPAPAPVPAPGDDCAPDQCGLNGMWFGQGLQFRELHLRPGIPNEQGLVLVGIVPPGVNHILELGIERDELLARDSNGQIFKRGSELKGARILIESTTRQFAPGTPTLFSPPNKLDVGDPVPLQFELVINNVVEAPFLDCSKKDGVGCDRAFHYEFLAATNANGGCRVEVCDPRLAESQDSTTTSVQGTAVVFAGDVYDDDRFGVRGKSDGPVCRGMALMTPEQDVINFACVGTVISKLYLLRHTWASEAADSRTTVPQRQAMLRMLTADYCGIGKSFTHNGTRIRFSAWHRPSYNGYAPEAGQPLEAVWTDRGASCIGTPRHYDYEQIKSDCAAAGGLAPAPCPATPPPGPWLLSAPLSPSASIGFSPGHSTDACAGARDSGNYLFSTLPGD